MCLRPVVPENSIADSGSPGKVAKFVASCSSRQCSAKWMSLHGYCKVESRYMALKCGREAPGGVWAEYCSPNASPSFCS